MARRPKRTSPAAARTPVYRRPGLDFSLNGFVYSGIMLFMGVAAMNLQASLLFGVFGLMVGVLLSSGILSKRMLRRLELNRQLPEGAVVGQPTLIGYSLANRKRYWGAFAITVSELDGVQSLNRQPYAYVTHVPAARSADFTCEILPRRRGLATFDRYQLSSGFPFGFVKRAIVRQNREPMLVFPPIGTIDRSFLQRFRSAETHGTSMRPRLRGNDEFYGLREFRAGESQRNIYWKRSARTGTLVAREMTHAAPPRLVVVIDSYNPNADAARATEIERSIAQAATLIDAAIEAGLAIGLVASDGADWHHIAPSRGKQHQRVLLTLLAKLPSGTVQQTRDGEAALEFAAGVTTDALTTLVLMTGGPATSTIGRGGRRWSAPVMSIGCVSPEAQAWFHFDASIDFKNIAPLELPGQRPAAPIPFNPSGTPMGGVGGRSRSRRS